MIYIHTLYDVIWYDIFGSLRGSYHSSWTSDCLFFGVLCFGMFSSSAAAGWRDRACVTSREKNSNGWKIRMIIIILALDIGENHNKTNHKGQL